MLSNRCNQSRRVPLLHGHEISAVRGLIEIDPVCVIGVHYGPGNEAGCFRKNRCSAVLYGIHPAPAIPRLVDGDLHAEPE